MKTNWNGWNACVVFQESIEQSALYLIQLDRKLNAVRILNLQYIWEIKQENKCITIKGMHPNHCLRPHKLVVVHGETVFNVHPLCAFSLNLDICHCYQYFLQTPLAACQRTVENLRLRILPCRQIKFFHPFELLVTFSEVAYFNWSRSKFSLS